MKIGKKKPFNYYDDEAPITHKKIDDEVVDQKEFQLSGDKLFEGWFKLG